MVATAQISRREMKRFERALGELVKRTQGGVSVVIRKVAFDLMRDVMLATPVDTGQARAGWMAAFDHLGGKAPAIGASRKPQKRDAKGRFVSGGGKDDAAIAAGKAASRARSELGAGVKRPFFEVTNAVKHILPLEYGHSRQAPSGMVRTTVRRHARHYLRELRKLK